MIIYSCPHCTRELHSADDLAGKQGKCPGCGKPMMIPHPVIPPNRVVIVGVDMPFDAIMALLIKWTLAALLVAALFGIGIGMLALILRPVFSPVGP